MRSDRLGRQHDAESPRDVPGGRAARRALVTLGLVALLAAPRVALAMCCPVPPEDSVILSSGQLNWVVMHRDRGEIELIPNVHVVGDPTIFGLVVPTPSLPSMAEVPASIWTQAAALTAPAARQSIASDGLGCNASIDRATSPASEDGGGVVVHEEKTVGAFHATIVSSDEPDALVQWLRDNEFEITSAQEAEIEPLTREGWFFTAMKLDTTQVTLPPQSWDITVDPVSFTYRAEELQVPLGFLSINRAPSFTMIFYVVDDHRMNLSGFQTRYGNRISAGEMEAIERAYPELSGYLSRGKFLTQLRRSFGTNVPMTETLALARASSDDEFRPTWDRAFLLGFAGSLPGHLLALSGLLALVGTLARRRR